MRLNSIESRTAAGGAGAGATVLSSSAESSSESTQVIPGRMIPIGTSDYRVLREKEGGSFKRTHADKSLFIYDFLNVDDVVTLITRPRRFGKSMLLSMVYYFLAHPDITATDTSSLFEDTLLLKKHPEFNVYQEKNPVIYIDFKGISGETAGKIISRSQDKIRELYQTYKTILMESEKLNSDEKKFVDLLSSIEPSIISTIPEEYYSLRGLKTLSQYLHKHYEKQVYILIDEYDTPLNHAQQKGFLEEVIGFYKDMLGAALKGNSALAKGLMVGILRLSKDSMLSDLNNLRVFTVLDDRYQSYFSFTESEVSQILRYHPHSPETFSKQMKTWYNGYQIGMLSPLTIYNPWSVLQAIEDKKLMPYWETTATDDWIEKILLQGNKTIKQDLIRLMSGEVILCEVDTHVRFDNLKDDPRALWSLLLFTGYLTSVGYSEDEAGGISHYQLKIPNYEIRGMYERIFLTWITSEEKSYSIILSDLVHEPYKTDSFLKKLNEFFLGVMSQYELNYEGAYHAFMAALSSPLSPSYYIYSNKESGQGRPDLILIPREGQGKRAFIFEFKKVNEIDEISGALQEASDQIWKKRYVSQLSSHPYIKELMCIGQVFWKKLAILSHEVAGLSWKEGALNIERNTDSRVLVYESIDGCIHAVKMSEESLELMKAACRESVAERMGGGAAASASVAVRSMVTRRGRQRSLERESTSIVSSGGVVAADKKKSEEDGAARNPASKRFKHEESRTAGAIEEEARSAAVDTLMTSVSSSKILQTRLTVAAKTSLISTSLPRLFERPATHSSSYTLEGSAEKPANGGAGKAPG